MDKITDALKTLLIAGAAIFVIVALLIGMIPAAVLVILALVIG
jgi:hypothetical protein